MRIIDITASRDALTASTQTIGCANDHLSTTFRILPDAALQGADYTYRLAFQAADGYRCLTELLPLTDGAMTFALPNVLMVEGQLQVQLIVYQNEIITHTPKAAPLTVLPSIAANTEIAHDYTGLIYPGVGIANAEIVDGDLIIHYQDGTAQNVGLVAPPHADFELEEGDGWQLLSSDKSTHFLFSEASSIAAAAALTISSGSGEPLLLNHLKVLPSQDGETSPLSNVADPIDDTDAANKRSVDAKMDAFGTVFKQDTSYHVDTDRHLCIRSQKTVQLHSGDDVVLVNGMQVHTIDQEGCSAVRGVADPTVGTDAVNKRYVDQAVATASASWTTLADVYWDDEQTKSTLMFPLPASAATMNDFQMAVILPFEEAVTAGAFHVKAFFTDAAVNGLNTIFSRSNLAVSAGGRVVISSDCSRIGEYLYATETVYTNIGVAKMPYTSLQMFDASLLHEPYLRLTMTNGYRFPNGTRIVLQGR